MSDKSHIRPEKLSLFEQGFEFIKYRDLPKSHQMAMAWYMAVDGEAWDDIIDYEKVLPKGVNNSDGIRWHNAFKEALEELLPVFIERYGDVEFGIATWNADLLIASISGDDVYKEDGIGFEEARASFSKPIRNYITDSYPREGRWPVIMSNSDDETLQDGWHRFQIYVSNGHDDIPVIFYPEEWHRALKSDMEAAFPNI